MPEKLGGIEEDYRKPEFATVIGLVVGSKNMVNNGGGHKKHRQHEIAAKKGESENIFSKLKKMFF